MKSAIEIYSFTSQTPVSGKLVRSGKAGQLFFLSDKGQLYSMRYVKGVHIYTAEKVAAYLGTNELRALGTLGVLSRKEINESKARAKQLGAQHARDRARNQLLGAAKQLGLKLTREQLKKAKS